MGGIQRGLPLQEGRQLPQDLFRPAGAVAFNVQGRLGGGIDVLPLSHIVPAHELIAFIFRNLDIQKLLLEKGKEAYYFPSFEEIEKFLREKCINGDLLITMGAGDVVNIGENLLSR